MSKKQGRFLVPDPDAEFLNCKAILEDYQSQGVRITKRAIRELAKDHKLSAEDAADLESVFFPV